MDKKFESFRIKNLKDILGGSSDTIYCKDANSNNIGTVTVDCAVPGTSGFDACVAAYPATQVSAGAC
jgi:hypothetical protein